MQNHSQDKALFGLLGREITGSSISRVNPPVMLCLRKKRNGSRIKLRAERRGVVSIVKNDSKQI